jgi:hypothetical protein
MLSALKSGGSALDNFIVSGPYGAVWLANATALRGTACGHIAHRHA